MTQNSQPTASNVIQLEERARSLRARSSKVDHLSSSGGDGTSGGMDPWQTSVETRLGQLHKGLEDVKEVASQSRAQLATLTERVAHLPSKGFIITVIVTGVAFLTALAVFQQKLQVVLGIVH